MHPASPVQPLLLPPPRRGRTPHGLARLALATAALLAGTSQAALPARDLDGHLATAEAVFNTSSQLTGLNQLSPGVFALDHGSQSDSAIGTVTMASTLVLDPGPPVISPAVPYNVALYRPVQVIDPDGELGNGGGWVGDSLAPAASLTDGVHLAEGNGWNSGTLFWTDANANGSFVARVQLDGLYTISRITLQADNNDAYLVRYQDAAGAWHGLTDVGAACCWGMATRDVAVAPVVASAFEIVAHDGDRFYALSEFQAFGISAVPEPHSWALLALGCAALAGRQQRQQGRGLAARAA